MTAINNSELVYIAFSFGLSCAVEIVFFS